MSARIHLGKSHRNIPESCQTQVQKDKRSRFVNKMSRERASKQKEGISLIWSGGSACYLPSSSQGLSPGTITRNLADSFIFTMDDLLIMVACTFSRAVCQRDWAVTVEISGTRGRSVNLAVSSQHSPSLFSSHSGPSSSLLDVPNVHRL